MMISLEFSRSTKLAAALCFMLILGGCLTGEPADSSLTNPGSASPENSAPRISGTPPTSIEVGEAYSFVPTASDADGDRLTFSIQNQPSWTSFDTSSGELTGTPALADAGTAADIVITVSDGTDSVSLPSFSITVSTVTTNSPPTISGTPATSISAGQQYSFTPTAADADGDSLTFSISGQPSWADFDASSGAITGSPGAGDVGVFANIVVSVSDGEDTASLPAFSITVEAMSLGSATLRWTAPTHNEDASVLEDLAGFKIYWGTTPGSYDNSATIDNPSVSTYVVENLAPGTYEFVATAYNEAGVESRFSGTATKVIQ